MKEHIHKKMLRFCKSLKGKIWKPLDVVAKDKCFYFSYAKDQLEENEDEDDRQVSEHFDFGLFGSTGTSEYNDETGKQFAYAYKREELKAKDCNPDILHNKMAKMITHIKLNTLTQTTRHLDIVIIQDTILMMITMLELQESLIVNFI